RQSCGSEGPHSWHSAILMSGGPDASARIGSDRLGSARLPSPPLPSATLLCSPSPGALFRSAGGHSAHSAHSVPPKSREERCSSLQQPRVLLFRAVSCWSSPAGSYLRSSCFFFYEMPVWNA
ncbi:hypothetical protein Z043_116401, partial [Scleropages formosus]